MSIPTDPQAQMSRLLELNGDIATAQETLGSANTSALVAADVANAAQLHLTALSEARDELLEAMKHTVPAAPSVPDEGDGEVVA